MLKRFIAFFVSFCLVLGFVCSSFVTFAVAPVALVEAALVSYVVSTGFKLWVDNGTGSDVLGLMSGLYSDWLLSLSGGTLTLQQIGNQDLVYYDNQGHIVIRQSAADAFQQFSEWLQSNYSVPVGDDTPTQIIAPSGASLSNGSGVTASVYAYNNGTFTLNGSVYHLTPNVGTYFNSYVGPDHYPMFLGSVDSAQVYITSYGSNFYIANSSPPSALYNVILYEVNGNLSLVTYTTPQTSFTTSFPSSTYEFNSASSSVNPSGVSVTDLTQSSGGLAGLAVTLGQSVVDVAGQASVDDSVVIGVGASAGASASDIVDTVAQGVGADTLNPSVSIVADSVIDTPVQPYPDVDSLGLPQLGLALTTRFPFSIPWDISAVYSAISAPSEPPVKTFDLIPASVLARWGINANTSITIDLTDQKYDVLLAIIHWSCIIGFCFGLAVMTKRYVWTTGG